MQAGAIAFGPFVLDPAERRLTRDGQPLDVGGRYFDALALLVTRPGSLVTKDEFHRTVWHGVPVTDEALTQCIRTLRRQLGDGAAAPLYIETVPRHGYRFVAAVKPVESDGGDRAAAPLPPIPAHFALAGSAGGALAGGIGGLLYGLGASADAAAAGSAGGASLLLVMLAVCIGTGFLGGLGVGGGVALALRRAPAAEASWRIVAGAALGGAIIGAAVRLIGLDAFAVLFARRPQDMTGGLEGALLGMAIGFAFLLARKGRFGRRGTAIIGAVAGGLAGLLLALAGRPLMAGSLAWLARTLPAPGASYVPVAHWIGDGRFGPLTATLTTVAEGALFGACVTAALALVVKPLRSAVLQAPDLP